MPFDGILPPPLHQPKLTRILHHYISHDNYIICLNNCQQLSINSLTHKIGQLPQKFGVAVEAFQNFEALVGQKVGFQFAPVKPVKPHSRILALGVILAYAFTQVFEAALHV